MQIVYQLQQFIKKVVEEAVRVIKEGPKWKPAMQDGKYVNFRQRQVITFVATKD